MSILARRTLPEDPALYEQLKAERIAARARAIAGRLTVLVLCWCCGATYDEGSDRYQLGTDGLPYCKQQDDCNDRAARAGLVIVLGEPGTGEAG